MYYLTTLEKDDQMMRFSRLALVVCVVGIWFLGTSRSVLAQTVDFEDLTLAPQSFYNGSDGAGGFVSQTVSRSWVAVKSRT